MRVLHEKHSNVVSLVGRNFGNTECKKHLLRESLCRGLNRFTHSHGGINILVLFEDSLSISQLLPCLYEQGLQNNLWNHTYMINLTPMHAQTNIKNPHCMILQLTFRSSSTCLSAFTLC